MKRDRADLNKLKAAFEDERKRLKKACMEPYNRFEQQVKEITALIDEPIQLIDSQLSEIEERRKQLKQKEIEDLFGTIGFQDFIDVYKRQVYCSCSGVCLEQLKGQLKELTEKGKKVVLVTDHPFELSGAIIYVTKEKGNQIGLITDSKYVLSGEYGQESRNTCVYSGQRNFVTLFKTALANEIELIKIREGENENE